MRMHQGGSTRSSLAIRNRFRMRAGVKMRTLRLKDESLSDQSPGLAILVMTPFFSIPEFFRAIFRTPLAGQ